MGTKQGHILGGQPVALLMGMRFNKLRRSQMVSRHDRDARMLAELDKQLEAGSSPTAPTFPVG